MITVRVNGVILNEASDISWSSVDPGGFEACTFSIPNTLNYPSPGSDVTVFAGTTIVWQGRVEEPGDNYNSLASLGQVSAVGYGARLKDDTMSMIFLDRDVNAWRGMSSQRFVNLGTAHDPKTAPEVMADTSTGSPALKLMIGPSIPGASGGRCEAWYDAGFGNTIKQLQLTSPSTGNLGAGGANWEFASYLADDDVATGLTNLMSDQDNATVAFRRDTAGTARRWALLTHIYGLASAASNNEFWRIVKDLAVIGNHGLTVQANGAGSDGIYPSDIANYARSQASNIDAGVIETASSFHVIHAPYRDRVTYEQIIDDMSKFMGWHWGVWEPLGLLNVNPRLDFRARPTLATAYAERRTCSQITLSKSLSSMYNRARVAYTDPFGAVSYVTITRNHPDLIGITRTIDLDIGVGTSTLATAYGNQILALSQTDSKSQGSITLPAIIRTRNADKPSYHLKAGLDRIQIRGMNPTTWISSTPNDSYRIRRVSSRTVGNGVVTTVEVDNGADLIEVLQARLGQAQFGSIVHKNPFVDQGRPGGV